MDFNKTWQDATQRLLQSVCSCGASKAKCYIGIILSIYFLSVTLFFCWFGSSCQQKWLPWPEMYNCLKHFRLLCNCWMDFNETWWEARTQQHFSRLLDLRFTSISKHWPLCAQFMANLGLLFWYPNSWFCDIDFYVWSCYLNMFAILKLCCLLKTFVLD